MSRLNSLHLNDLEAHRAVVVHPNRSGRRAAIVTVVAVLVGGALFVLMSDDPPRSVPTGPATVGAPIAPASADPALTPGGTTAAASAPLTVAIPAGTKLSLEIVESISTADAIVGKEIVATLAAPVTVDGSIAIPAGSRVVGHVTETLELSATEGNGIFGVTFDRIEIDGKSTAIAAELRGQKLDLAPGRQLEIELSQAVDLPLPNAAV